MTTPHRVYPAFLWTAVGASIPVNVLGAILFSGPLASVRALVGMPPIEPLFAWMLSSWILAFGLAFARIRQTRVMEPTLLAVSALGKLTFVLTMAAGAITGRGSVLAALSAFPDLVLAAAFAYGLVAGHRTHAVS